MSYSEDLLGLQNPDGGWSYRRGGSWTEPTCYALLGLLAEKGPGLPAIQRAAAWLKRCQRSDGGFAPRESVEESSWTTALALLLPPEAAASVDQPAALRWLLSQTGNESTWVSRLRMWMLGIGSQDSVAFDGWPWYPGAAAWVAPTAFSIMALERAARSDGGAPLRDRLTQGRSFLLARRCRDGGWNHGSTRALGYDSDSYPEATGLALLALRAVRGPDIDAALERAERYLVSTRSQEAGDWLRLGMLAHGRMPAVSGEQARAGTLAIALAAITKAAQAGRNVFLT